MSIDQLETRLGLVERLIQTADVKDLPALNATYQKLLDRIVALDLAGLTSEPDPPTEPHRPA